MVRLWKSSNDKFVDHEVDGKPIRFAPLRAWRWLEIKPILAPLAKAFAVYFSDRTMDAGVAERNVVQGNSEDEPDTRGFAKEQIREAISIDMAKFRDGQKAEAFEALIETALSEHNMVAVGTVLLHCMPYEIDRDQICAKEAEELMQDVLPHQLVGLLEGAWKANKDALLPLIEKLLGKANAAQAAQEQKIKQGPRPSSTTAPNGDTSSKPSSGVSSSESPSPSLQT